MKPGFSCHMKSLARAATRMLGGYQAGTRLDHAEAIIDFDRRLCMLVLDGVERIELAMRMQLGYLLGRISAFAHADPSSFTTAFAEEGTNPESGEPVAQRSREVARARPGATGEVRRAVRRPLQGEVRRPDAGLGAHQTARVRPFYPLHGTTPV